jgi:hypothetical protein
MKGVDLSGAVKECVSTRNSGPLGQTVDFEGASQGDEETGGWMTMLRYGRGTCVVSLGEDNGSEGFEGSDPAKTVTARTGLRNLYGPIIRQAASALAGDTGRESVGPGTSYAPCFTRLSHGGQVT